MFGAQHPEDGDVKGESEGVTLPFGKASSGGEDKDGAGGAAKFEAADGATPLGGERNKGAEGGCKEEVLLSGRGGCIERDVSVGDGAFACDTGCNCGDMEAGKGREYEGLDLFTLEFVPVEFPTIAG